MATVHSAETLGKLVVNGGQRVKRLPEADVDAIHAYAKANDRPLIWAIRMALSEFAAKIRVEGSP